jgi:hypothetical protein
MAIQWQDKGDFSMDLGNRLPAEWTATLAAADASALRLADRVLSGEEIAVEPVDVLNLANIAFRNGRFQASRELTAIAARLRAAQCLSTAVPRRC